MNRDPQLLLTIQVALIGILVVVGFFFIWRALSRMEARIDELSSRDCRAINHSCQMVSDALSGGYDTREVDKTKYKKAISSYEKEDYVDKEDDDDDDDDGDHDDDEEYKDDDEYNEDEDDIAMMKACFSGTPFQTLLDDAVCPFTIFKSTVDDEYDSDFYDSVSEKTNTKVVLEEAQDESDKSVEDEKQKDNSIKMKEEASTTDTDTQEFSKTKLKKMNLDALREVCSSRGLPLDGSKTVLMDRILSSIPSFV